MAIQIRRGTNAGWEASKSNIVVGEPAVATDTERAFIGTGGGLYMELANLTRVAPVYDPSVEYEIGDICSWQGEIYMANARTSGAFNIACWDRKSFSAILKDFKTNMFNGYETNTITDVDIASFDNGAGGIPVVDLAVDIEATQDLHGYSHPWAGGAGKNLLNCYNFAVGESKVMNGLTCTMVSDGVFVLNGTTNANNTFFNLNITSGQIIVQKGVAYKLIGGSATPPINVQVLGNSFPAQSSYSSTTPLEFTIPSTATDTTTWIRLQVQYSGTTINNATVRPMLMLASETNYTWEPYSNICPIDGFDEVKVWVDSTYGGTIGWNQMSDVATSSQTQNGVTRSYNASTHKMSLVGTATATIWFQLGSSFNLISGHKYLLSGAPPHSASAFMYLLDGENRVDRNDVGGVIWKSGGATGIRIYYVVYNGTTMNVSFYPMLFDLTQMFGTEKADEIYAMEQAHIGDGVAYFKSLFPKDYYEYNAGEETCVSAVNGEPYRHYTTAVNVWDEEWEQGGISISNGQNVAVELAIRSKNYCPCLPSTSYYLLAPSNASYAFWYDASKNYISNEYINASKAVVSPSNAVYLRLRLDNYGTTYGNNVSINFPSNNTNYIPYKGSTATQNYMDTFGHGVYGGTLNATAGVLTITHKAVDGGSLSWGYWAGDNFYVNVPEKTSIDGKDILCSYYATINYNSGLIGTFTLTGNDFQKECIYVNDPQYEHNATGASALKTNVTGQTFVYRLKTPLTVQLTPQEVETVYKNNNVWANSGDIKVLVYRMTRH